MLLSVLSFSVYLCLLLLNKQSVGLARRNGFKQEETERTEGISKSFSVNLCLLLLNKEFWGARPDAEMPK
jgi:hypothetical protein